MLGKGMPAAHKGGRLCCFGPTVDLNPSGVEQATRVGRGSRHVPLVALCLGRRLSRQLQNGCRLTLAQKRQQHGAPIRKFERIVMCGPVCPCGLVERLPSGSGLSCVHHSAQANRQSPNVAWRRPIPLPATRTPLSRDHPRQRTHLFLSRSHVSRAYRPPSQAATVHFGGYSRTLAAPFVLGFSSQVLNPTTPSDSEFTRAALVRRMTICWRLGGPVPSSAPSVQQCRRAACCRPPCWAQ